MNFDFTLPDDAPFTDEQKQWLKDYYTQKAVASQPAAGQKVSILWGSQTGNSEILAKKTGKALAKAGFTPTVYDMGEYAKDSLSKEDLVLIITSTYGDGDPPDNAMDLHAWLLSDSAPRLEGLQYSVLALGDTDYPDFCKAGIEFDERLAALGAKPIYPRVDCEVDFDDSYAAWRGGVMSALGTQAATAEADVDDTPQGYSKKNPFPSAILINKNLNGEGSAKQTHHIEMSLEGSELEYQTGDALGVYPVNPAEVVDQIIKSLPFNTNEDVPLPDGGEGSLRDALMYHYDIRKLTRGLVLDWQQRSGSPMLRSVCLAEDKQALDDFMWGRELIDLALDYPADFDDGEEFVSILKKLQPRLYSISSSPKAHPGEVHLTVGIVKYHSHFRDRGGVCSTFLADRADSVKPGVFVHTNKAFRVPEDTSTDIIMVGPGTGVAPFRAFLEERIAMEAKGRNWLLFGEQHEATDFLYREELQQMMADGHLAKLDLAFSRDQQEKIYVQTRMKQNAAEIWEWLQGGACFYVCGDASRMAKDVDQALHEIAQEQGGLSEGAAVEFIKDLRAKKRYSRDVY
ncbi:MAG: sulfite reductase subunit alpha [Akkermansiaceae bacterium]